VRLTTLASRLLDLFGPEARSWIEFHSGHRSWFYPWGGPMNDQTARQRVVRALIHAVQPAHAIETGTYRGVTTEWLARFGVPVLTIESEERAFLFARRRLARFGHVRVVRGDSVDVLRALPHDDRVVFCYLDAHDPDHTPLRDELRAVVERMPRAVVVIDDFAIPDDAGYGANEGIDLEALDRSGLPRPCGLFFPTVPSSEETGHRRGAAVVTWDRALAERIATVELLRPR